MVIVPNSRYFDELGIGIDAGVVHRFHLACVTRTMYSWQY
jgi:hypothetical protein